MRKMLLDGIKDHQRITTQIIESLIGDIEDIAKVIIRCLIHKGTIFWCGNGGSASDALHLSAELVGRFEKEREAYSSIALSSNVSTLTSIGNDYGFENIFSRQVEGVCNRNDVLIGISTSGNSANIVRALEVAKSKGVTTVGFLGRDGGKLRRLCDYPLVIDSNNTARIQEMHIMIGHCICQVVEFELISNN